MHVNSSHHSKKPAPRSRKKPRPYESVVRARTKEKTRKALVDAALALFSERGLDAPSIDEICTRAGYSRGAFYAHFAGRDELVVEAMGTRRRATLDGLLEAARGGDGLHVTALLELLGSLIAAGSFPPKGRVRSAEFLQACRRSKKLRTAHLELLTRMTERLAEMAARNRESGAMRDDVNPVAVGALLVVLEAGAEVMVNLGWDYDVVAVAKVISRLLAASRPDV